MHTARSKKKSHFEFQSKRQKSKVLEVPEGWYSLGWNQQNKVTKTTEVEELVNEPKKDGC